MTCRSPAPVVRHPPAVSGEQRLRVGEEGQDAI